VTSPARLIRRAKAVAARPKPGAPVPRALRDIESEAALEALRSLPVPRLPRPPEEIARLVEGERKRWGKPVCPGEAETLRIVSGVVGIPLPDAFPSADAYALSFAAWLEASDARLVGEVAAR
jgi:hypothetical protein